MVEIADADAAPETGQTVRLADYQPPPWLIDDVRLDFDLAPRATRVRARIAFRLNDETATDSLPPLRLDGRKLTLVSAAIDGQALEGGDALTLDREGMTVAPSALPGPSFEWDCTTEIDPDSNTELEGLYLSNGMFCTQCEAEGFRKITYYPDRPDVMAPFTVRIEADASSAPILLSNGNPGTTGALAKGRHFAEWHDPFPKPAYLFALVAGRLVSHEDRFVTASGREVDLKLWVRAGDETRCAYAMDALERSMVWDEQAYGREYDLDLFQIVAVDDFNMGAMENKGLNIFNSRYVLASPDTATDRDYALIEGIVAHEYFHNWTGNRITCRDWFQLCLKEGLTVFRDQCFSEDERSEAVCRIDAVKALRARQFPEDAGPLAHPVRPEAYIEINNFYTATVYEKGAEIIRMLRTLVGAEGYRAALDLYFERHDGQACTIEQFRACFEDACGIDLSRFARWWSQAGTPRLSVKEAWDGRVLSLTLTQQLSPTPGQSEKSPLVIPLALGVLDGNGREVLATTVVALTEQSETICIAPADGTARLLAAGETVEGPGNQPRPTVSLLRGFSAPVILEREIEDTERAFLLAHDTDPFNRWEAGRRYAMSIALTRTADPAAAIPDAWTDALGRVLADRNLDPAFRALVLELPGNDEVAAEIAGQGGTADPDAIHHALQTMRQALGERLGSLLTETYGAMAVAGPYTPDAASAGQRALRNRCLTLFLASDSAEAHRTAETHFDDASNMTDSLAALTALVHSGAPGADARLEAFRARWSGDELVMDKWFAVQATAPLPGAVDRVEALTKDTAFSWKRPNRFRSVIASFGMANPVGFHAQSGAGYRFVAYWLIRLDALNPQTAARVCGCFESWRRYTPHRQALMRAELERIAALNDLSRNSREIVERLLAG
ncbi:MAG: aminopeptidase N [Pseudomonadota bacterium]